MKSKWVAAESAWQAYPVREFYNSTLVRMAARKLNLTTDGANSMLMSRVAVPTRGNKVKATSKMVAYRYLKRRVSQFFEMLGKTAVKAYVNFIHERTDMGGRVPMPGSGSRTTLELSTDDAVVLLTAERFIHESYSHMGLLAGLKAIFAYLNASNKIIEPAGAGESGEVVACLSSQYALVATKVREHLKLHAARSGPAGQQDGAGMNEGHRDP